MTLLISFVMKTYLHQNPLLLSHTAQLQRTQAPDEDILDSFTQLIGALEMSPQNLKQSGETQNYCYG